MLLALGFRLILYSPILELAVLKVIKTDVSMSWIIALAVILIMLVIVMLFKVAMPRFTKVADTDRPSEPCDERTADRYHGFACLQCGKA